MFASTLSVLSKPGPGGKPGRIRTVQNAQTVPKSWREGYRPTGLRGHPASVWDEPVSAAGRVRTGHENFRFADRAGGEVL